MNSKMKKLGKVVAVVIAICSILLNGYHVAAKSSKEEEPIWNYHFPDANSRATYETIHHVSEAQKKYTGAGVKVGILDWCFGYKDHTGLYAGGKDFTSYQGHKENYAHASEHGFWMAQTLKEIAPGVEIYALSSYVPDDEDAWVDAMMKAIKWAKDNKIDILTLSHEPISKANRPRFDKVVEEAIHQGIVTTFIHYDNKDNILPWGIWEEGDTSCTRDEDINIFQYDYNMFLLDNYKSIHQEKDYDQKYKSELFTSVSSMSVVTAGFVAMLKEADPTKTPQEYKKILVDTSRTVEYENDRADHVVDILAAMNYLKNDNKNN